ncbi:MAG: nucleotidyltransferase family protein [Syntrophobacteraceae bacterium]
MDLNNLLEQKRNDIMRIAAKHGARNVRIFGSVARSEDVEDSDIDLLVDFEDNRSLFDQGGLCLDLQELLGCKVHVVTEGSLYWLIRRRILKEARPL